MYIGHVWLKMAQYDVKNAQAGGIGEIGSNYTHKISNIRRPVGVINYFIDICYHMYCIDLGI